VNVLGYQLRLVLTAIQYFTRLPVPRWVGYSERQLNDASRYFPLVGILVGLFTGVVFVLTLRVFPQPIAVLLAMLSGILLTGGFHEDGLTDTCDGFGGGQDRPQILAIMKDSRVGSYGVLGLVFALLLKFSALAMLPAAQFVAISAAASRKRPSVRAHSVTRHPSAASAFALARPSPRLDPVTIATLSFSPRSIAANHI